MGSGHIILLIFQLKRLNFASNMALKGHFWGEKYPIKDRKAHPDGESKTTLPSRSRIAYYPSVS
jgi:hypothetical protein